MGKSLTKHWRFGLVLAVLVCALLFLLIRLSSLQLFNTEKGVTFLQGQGDARTIRTETVVAARGMIVDRHGQALAVSTPVVTLWANPKELLSYQEKLYEQYENGRISQDEYKIRLDEHKTKLATMASLLRFSRAELLQRLDIYKNKQFMYLRRQESPQLAEQVLDLKIQGVYGKDELRRFYPAAEVTSQIIGFTSIEGKGQEGLELAYDASLQGKNGKNRVVKDLHSRTIKTLNTIDEAKPGQDLVLSIDLRLQHLAYRNLKQAVTEHRADAGMTVVLDVKTGEVLAMANLPSFNPNNRSSITAQGTRNRALIDTFEPGSTVKPMTVLAALESGQYTADTIVDTSPGRIRVNRKTLLDPVNYGQLDLASVLIKSSQVGTTKVALSLEHEQLVSTFARMGMGQFTGTGFPGENSGMLPARTRWSDIEKASFSFGYGLTVTAMQLAEAYAIFANGGVKQQASLLRKSTLEEGERIIDPNYAQQINHMLEEVTGPRGTAKAARLQLYTTAGKTGTAHKVGASGYESRYQAYFAGFAPAKDPRLAIVVVIDNPKGDKYYGGEVAAPVFASIAADSLRMLNVTPDKWPNNHQIVLGGR